MAGTPRIRSPRLRRRLLWLAFCFVALGGAVAIVAAIGSGGQPPATPLRGEAVDVSKAPEQVRLDPAAKRVAREFVLTAVARRHLERAYDIAGPAIRQGQSRASWMSGDIAVVPFPVDRLDLAPMKVDYAYPDEAGLQVALLPKQGKGQVFSMTLVKRHGDWLVNGWAPASAPPVPAAG